MLQNIFLTNILESFCFRTIYLTTSTAPGLTFGSAPIIETLAERAPWILNTTVSVCGGRTAR